MEQPEVEGGGRDLPGHLFRLLLPEVGGQVQQRHIPTAARPPRTDNTTFAPPARVSHSSTTTNIGNRSPTSHRYTTSAQGR